MKITRFLAQAQQNTDSIDTTISVPQSTEQSGSGVPVLAIIAVVVLLVILVTIVVVLFKKKAQHRPAVPLNPDEPTPTVNPSVTTPITNPDGTIVPEADTQQPVNNDQMPTPPTV